MNLLEQKKAVLKESNPFYGCKDLFALYKNEQTADQYLRKAWEECKDNKQFKELFHIINFNIGSVNRSHNIFKKSKVDDGGKSINHQWIKYLMYLLNNDVEQFIVYLKYNPVLKCSLFFEFVSPREFLYYQIKTSPKTKNIIGTWGLLKTIINHANPLVYQTLLDTVESYIRHGNEFQKWQMAKMIHVPKFSKRQKRNKEGTIVAGGRELQKQTKDKFDVYETLCDDISKRLEWYVIDYGNNKRYVGFINWRKEYIANTEYVLFSTKKITEKDKTEFLQWLTIQPAGSRYRTKRRLFNPNNEDKWTNRYGQNLKELFELWEEYKKDAQAKTRVLEEKERTQGLTDDEKRELAKVKKDAKVTTGALGLSDYIYDFMKGKTDDVTVDAIVGKTKSELPILINVDCSGSMEGGWSSGFIRPVDMARLITTITMLNNPASFSNLLFTFGSVSHCYTDYSTGIEKNNRFMQGKIVKVERIIDRTKTFMENYNNICKFVTANEGSTNISGFAEKVKEWVDTNDGLDKNVKIEQLLQYQVILVISDSEFNNRNNQAKSLLDVKQKLNQWFGWNGVIVVWDIDVDNKNKSDYFDNIDNVIHITGTDPTTLDQIFTKITDVDIVDIYTPLKSLYMNNRYDVIKQYVL